MREVANLKRIGDEFSQAGRRHPEHRHHPHAGPLFPARAGGATAQALPQGPARACTKACPSRWRGCCWTTVAEIGLATEALAAPRRPGHPCPAHEWQHVMVPRLPGTPWPASSGPTLEQLVAHPLVLATTHADRPHPHRPGLRAAPPQARDRAGGDRLRRHQDLRPGSGLGVGIVAEMAVRDDPPGRDLVLASARPPVRPERHARRIQARRLPALVRLHLRRTALRPPDPRAAAVRDERRRPATLRPLRHAVTSAPASRLPHVGTTIFTVMSALAAEHGAVNLGQGFPDFDCDPRAGRRGRPPRCAPATTSIRRWPASPPLREAIAAKIERLYGRRYDAGHRDHRHRRRDAGAS